MKVKNLNGTAGRTAPDGTSWKDFWEKKSGKKWPSKCAVKGCSNAAEVGGHVKKVDSYDNSWYIVPLCYSDNNKKDAEFDVDSSMLVSIYH